ncbi:nuclear transport factor 2 family protein [Maricaulis sp.]|uniref:nuclear transport factor 2 family protein n=1 Tax=Maricaulis sp. TaxID=1486257 RepID=UPI003A90F616
MNRLVLSLLACLTLAGPAMATGITGNSREIAEAYLAAYQRQDHDAMRALYAENARFIDPTSLAIPQITAPIDWRGADAIIAGISSWGIDHLNYTVERSYESSGAVIFDGRTVVSYETAIGERRFIYPIITIITVQDGKVVEHRDYTDFAGARELPAPPSRQTRREK